MIREQAEVRAPETVGVDVAVPTSLFSLVNTLMVAPISPWPFTSGVLPAV
jgi:hypothetical protein